ISFFPPMYLGLHMDPGYPEGLVRGFKASLLTQQDYINLALCETLEYVRVCLPATDHGNFLANLTNSLTVSVSKIDTKMKKKLCRKFGYFCNHSLELLSTYFLHTWHAVI
uniref:Uncharacterized protein n=1 Tax=Suricata suricatta TaxID=37032 RepID=A0A673TZQ9_SURSU